jgi:hypothetical protein
MHNKLPKFAAKSAAGTNTHWASPNNVRICPLAKPYVDMKLLITLLFLLSTVNAYSKSIECEVEIVNEITKPVDLQIKDHRGKWKSVKIGANSSIKYRYTAVAGIKWFLVSPRRDSFKHEGTINGCQKTLVISGVNST